MMAEFRFQFMERGVTLLLLILLPLAFFTTEASFLPRDASYFRSDLSGYPVHLTAEDFQRAKTLTVDGEPHPSILTVAGEFEGDIAGMSSATIQNFVQNENGQNRNAIRNTHYLWPDGRVPYSLSNRYSDYARAVIASALAEYSDQTCIKFVPKTDEPDYLYFDPGFGCSSMVGRMGGQQLVTLGLGCLFKGIIMHELMHAIGFFHEQSRTDRDNHINILWENVLPGYDSQFQKYSLEIIQLLDTPYDYSSIMHYGATDFSRNGQPTIQAKEVGQKIGQRYGFSAIDVFKINKMYNCAKEHVERGNVIQTMPTDVIPVIPVTLPPTDAPPALNCFDANQFCSDWSSAGFCNSSPEFNNYMLTNCKKSCKLC